jgi:hypothetical protein
MCHRGALFTASAARAKGDLRQIRAGPLHSPTVGVRLRF